VPGDFPVGDALAEVHHCDFRDLPVGDGTARLVFTDPLYHREHLGLYTDLGEWAARVLQPGGLLVTYLRTSFLPEVVRRLGQHLTYVRRCDGVLGRRPRSTIDTSAPGTSRSSSSAMARSDRAAAWWT